MIFHKKNSLWFTFLLIQLIQIVLNIQPFLLIQVVLFIQSENTDSYSTGLS